MATPANIHFDLQLDEDDSTANQMKKSMSGFLNHVSEVFTPPPDDGDQEAIVIVNQQPVILNRLQVINATFNFELSVYLHMKSY